MTTELWMLVGVIGIYIAIVFVQAVTLIAAVGPQVAAGNREDLAAQQSGIAGRAQRAVSNHVEGLAMFAPLVLVMAVAGISTPLSVLAAKIYFGSRLAHALTYIFGIIWLRTVAFAAGVVAITLLLITLIRG